MSEWYDAKPDDIDIDSEAKEVDIFVKEDEHGRVYVSLTFDQIKEIYEQIK